MNKKISLLLPTRERPILVKRLFQSIKDYTFDLDNIEIVLCLDDDDRTGVLIDDARLNILKIVGCRSTMGEYNTRCMKHATGDILMLINDDLIVRTSGWDQIIRDLFESVSDGILMAYPDDMEKADLSTFPIMSRRACDILVNPYPAEYESLFIDDHLFDIFTRLKYMGKDRMFYLRNIKFDHRHFINGKVRPDAGYSHKNRYQDYLTFMSLRYLRQVSAQRLLAVVNNAPLPEMTCKIVLPPSPQNLSSAMSLAFSVFILDHGLPLSRRLRWFIRFTKYYAAMKSGINFLKRKTYLLYGS